MNKTALVLACLALPLAAVAAQPAPQAQRVVQRPAAGAASAPGSAASAPERVQHALLDNRSAMRASKERGSQMGVCREQVAQRGLSGPAYRAALGECMNKPVN
ncbi:MAG: hypothetical protein RLZZ584_537 [Pseudomonadota bacterium]|jgi:hypothetical protein